MRRSLTQASFVIIPFEYQSSLGPPLKMRWPLLGSSRVSASPPNLRRPCRAFTLHSSARLRDRLESRIRGRHRPRPRRGHVEPVRPETTAGRVQTTRQERRDPSAEQRSDPVSGPCRRGYLRIPGGLQYLGLFPWAGELGYRQRGRERHVQLCQTANGFAAHPICDV